jgi:hypothetical protein
MRHIENKVEKGQAGKFSTIAWKSMHIVQEHLIEQMQRLI